MKTNSMKISIIIPFYNALPYFKQTIESILNQSYTNIELILVDDKSIDGSLDLAKQYQEKDSRVKIVQNPVNSQVSKSRNNGLMHATGDFVYFLDADDFLEENALELLTAKAIEDNSDVVLMDACLYYSESKKTYLKNFYKDDNEPWKYGASWWYMFKRDLVIENTDVRFPDNSRYAEDLCFSFMILNLTDKISYVSKALINYRQHDSMITKQNKDSKFKQDIFISFSKIIDFISKHEKNINYSEAVNDFKLILRQHKPELKKLRYNKLNKKFKKIDAFSMRRVSDKSKVNSDDNVNIFFASDDNYAPALLTSITSMLENTQEFVNIYVLDSDISKKSKRKIKKCLKKYNNFSLEYLTIDTDFIKSSFPEGEFYVSYATYNRLFISKLKPNLKKVIYSDVDIIFTGDVAVLNNEDLEGHTLGVVEDAIYLINDNLNNYQGRLNLPKSHNYFYAGMLLIDNQKWIEENITEKALQLAKEKADDLLQGDQDILNILFENNYKKLSPKYEATHGYVYNADKFSDEVQEDLKLENVIIRHYEGSVKPWHSYSIKDSNLFWEQAKNTPFYRSLIINLYKNKICKIALLSVISLIPIKKVRKQYRQKLKKVYS